MEYIVIENFDPLWPVITTDEEGMTKMFETLEEAQEEADNCQDGQIVPIGVNLIHKEEEMKYVIKEMYQSHKDGTFNIVHIGDLVCKILGIEATFLPSGKIEEHE